jgi:hypothetical protein
MSDSASRDTAYISGVADASWAAAAQRVARALGLPRDVPLTRGALEDRVDVHVRAMAILARTIGGNPLEPMTVVAEAEKILAVRQQVRIASPAQPAPSPVALDGLPPRTDLSAAIVDGRIRVTVGGIVLQVDQVSLVGHR